MVVYADTKYPQDERRLSFPAIKGFEMQPGGCQDTGFFLAKAQIVLM